ncbi:MULTISPECIES: Na+/H+ antiporter NhaC family protein [unclassified Butyrivibrio]|uniref:Na+/H+ antiporter NhaC family protein n=1 Tax=unclassified Butyrivibrio TaxID=2639466 RepID=UPI00088536F1|nr:MULTISPECIES: Na+/H+ antiporter NhaC family protein [unclassified Butyrivibrio]SDB34729.1 Na+/H+ antiporter NhaC [Butyrivibrio sp. INlla16]SEM08375.1 Na+/H+ antiporter NhaC [Butyrivibrio sp. ob235]
MFVNSFWALLPAIIAIALALITKEVYSSLFVGILVGGLLYTNFSFTATMQHVFVDGMIGQLSDGWNVGILIFLVVLGSMVMLMNRAGGSAAFGKWATTHVKTKTGAQLATIALGCLIFIDDYFNCLTVGSVMRPLTDKHKISREKLAYLIDATAAPVCIIAPISSWAAAVTGFVDGANGLTLFVRAIPYNFYALLTIVMMLTLTFGKIEFGPMKKAELRVGGGADKDSEKNKRHSSMTGAEDQPTPPVSVNGRVIHLVLPIITLIVCCVIGMIYTGGFFEGTNFVDAFAGSDASVGLVYGSVVALVITIIFMVATKVLSFTECMNAIPEGFKSMVPAIMILTFAWTLKSMTDSLGAAEYVGGLVANIADKDALMSLLPAIVFIIGAFLAFATGTSWGTFGILIPIVAKVFGSDMGNELMIISISACMAGAVCGDHCSPISDTTIMASAGAECKHINHVSTQLPYAITAAIVSCVAYIIAGFVRNWIVCLIVGIGLMIFTVFGIHAVTKE